MNNYWMTSIKAETVEKTIERVKHLVVEHNTFAVTGKWPMNEGDFICLYAARIGIVCAAQLSSSLKQKVDSHLFNTNKPVWAFEMRDVRLFIENPVAIDAEIRGKLDAYKVRGPHGNWGWFFQGTRKLSEHDFRILTRS